MSAIDKSVSAVLDRYAAAVLSKDVELFTRLYDPKVRVFDLWGVWIYEDLTKWQIAVEGWFTSLGEEKVKVSFDEVHVLGGPDMTLVSAIVTYTALSKQGERLRAMHNRLTWGLRTSGHVLRIVHEHTSAPIGFEDMKAILQRKSSS